MQFLSRLSCIKFQTCSKPLPYRSDKSPWKSYLGYMCDFALILHRVAATKITCVNGPLELLQLLCARLVQTFYQGQSIYTTLASIFAWGERVEKGDCFFKWVQLPCSNSSCEKRQCTVPENIYTPAPSPQRRDWNFLRVRGSVRLQN